MIRKFLYVNKNMIVYLWVSGSLCAKQLQLVSTIYHIGPTNFSRISFQLFHRIGIALWLDKRLHFISFLFFVWFIYLFHCCYWKRAVVASLWIRFWNRRSAHAIVQDWCSFVCVCVYVYVCVRAHVVVFLILNCFVIDCCWMEMRAWVMSNI